VGTVRFSSDDGFDFAVRCILSGIGYGMADPGEVLATAEAVEGGDLDGWFDRWTALGAACDRIAEGCAHRGHRESAAQAWLRAANYRFAAFYYVLGTADPGRHGDAWLAHRRSLDAALAHWATPVERFEVPWQGTPLRAWHFRAPDPTPRPVALIHNGLASPLSDAMMTGALDGVARGWDVVAFDGPGQGHARMVDGVGPADEWEAVGRAVLDAALARAGVDRGRVAAIGISDGGYLAARHAGADPRVAALVCDPGVVRPVEGALGGLPDALQQAWRRGDGAAIDAAIDIAGEDPAEAFALAKLVEQWPGLGAAEVLARLARWDLIPLADGIRVPVLIADPDAAMSFPGQSGALASLLDGRGHLVPFSSAEGAGLDCEIGAPRLRNQRVFDWLDEVLPPPTRKA